MSLLQETLDKIEASAARQSAVVVANADAILELGMLAEMLRANGATDVRPVVTAHEYCDPGSAGAVTLRVLSFADHPAVIGAMERSGMSYVLEVEGDGNGRARAIARIAGLAAYIEMVDYVNDDTINPASIAEFLTEAA